VVIAIIALLVSILMPALSKAREIAKGAACQSNLKNIGSTLHIYRSDNNEGMVGWFFMTHSAPSLLPESGHTSWMLELYRTMFSKTAQFADNRAIWETRHTGEWTRAMPMLLCPNDVDKSHDDPQWQDSGKSVTSYKTSIYTWTARDSKGIRAYWRNSKDLVGGDPVNGVDDYWPVKTQYFNFSNMPRASDTVMLSEIRYNNGFLTTDGTGWTANSAILSWGDTIRNRYFHPGAGKLRDSSGTIEWEGVSSYLFFDGHVGLRQLPPYSFGGGPAYFEGNIILPTYREYAGL